MYITKETNQISFSTLKVGQRDLFATAMVTTLSLIITFTGVDGPWLIQKLGMVVLIKTGPELLSHLQHNRCHFVSLVIITSSTKFEKHCFNILRDILYLT